MLFNSYEFLFAFLPATIVVFLLVGRVSRSWALGWLIVASLFFYAWWRPVNLFIIGPALVANFAFAKVLEKLVAEGSRPQMAKLVLVTAITLNICLLGYFKYATFIKSTLNDFAGADFVLTQIILPLGISFITFQKIAFLIDVHGKRVQSFTFRDFCLFILFFPQLIAGPIVHFRETMPQFRASAGRLERGHVAVGMTLLAFGLFKKVVLADGIAVHVTPIYALAADGGAVSLFPAWLAAVGFTLQIYFDFSAYSDMATGIARCFGIRLPLNFDSPLKASSIIDFWSRWHVTLTRFLTAYLYNPLLLALTRRRVKKGLRGLGAKTSTGAFLQLLAGPTLLTMFVSGLWHGAGFLFIAWGLLHGVYLTINHAWRLVGPKLWSSKEAYARFMRPAGFVLTFLSVAFAMVLFRATSADAAFEILGGMIGLNGMTLPANILSRLPGVGALPWLTADGTSIMDFVVANAWMAGLLLIALLLPNTLEVTSRFEPVLDMQDRVTDKPSIGERLKWSPTIAWGIFVSILAAAAVYRVGGESEFLYWQF
jgi:D-alanyl-lipoteichoic acid acyltransferase DltB (MBOAT superfamily)